MTTEADIQAAMTALDTGNNNVVAVLNNGGNAENNEILSIFNADSAANTVTLPEGEWNVYVDKDTAGTEILATVSGTVEVEATSAMILVKAGEEVEEPTDAPTEEETKAPSKHADIGDKAMMTMWMVLAAVCVIGGAVLVTGRKIWMNI